MFIIWGECYHFFETIFVSFAEEAKTDEFDYVVLQLFFKWGFRELVCYYAWLIFIIGMHNDLIKTHLIMFWRNEWVLLSERDFFDKLFDDNCNILLSFAF